MNNEKEMEMVEVKEKKSFFAKAWDGIKDGVKKVAPVAKKVVVPLATGAAGFVGGMLVAGGFTRSPEDEDGPIVDTGYREVEEEDEDIYPEEDGVYEEEVVEEAE